MEEEAVFSKCRTAARIAAALAAAAFTAACSAGPSADADDSRRRAAYVDTLLPALRIQTDAARGRIWWLDQEGVALYDVRSRRLVRRIALPDWILADGPFNCAPDLVLDTAGNVLVTSNAQPALWWINAESLAVHRQELVLDSDQDKDVGLTGLAFAPGARVAIGADAHHGTLWRIDPDAGTAAKITLAASLRGACGLALRAAAAPGTGSILCIPGNSRVKRVDLSADLRRGKPSDRICLSG